MKHVNSTETSGTTLSGSSKLRVLWSDVTQSEFRGLEAVLLAWMPDSHPTSNLPLLQLIALLLQLVWRPVHQLWDEEIFVSGVI